MFRQSTSLYEDEQRRHRKNVRVAKRARNRTKPRVIAKPGTRPLSRLHPQHPARLYGWDSEQSNLRDRRVWA